MQFDHSNNTGHPLSPEYSNELYYGVKIAYIRAFIGIFRKMKSSIDLDSYSWSNGKYTITLSRNNLAQNK